MDVNELNLLFTNIVRQIKLCECPETIAKNGSLGNETDKNDPYSNNICQVCDTAVPAADKDIVLKMKSVFHKTLQEIGIDLNSIPHSELMDDTNFTENSYYVIDYDTKYLKRNTKGETPLHSAAGKKDVKIITEMLKNNVNPNTQDNAGWTPLHEAVFKDNLVIASELLLAGAIVNVPGYDYTTPLHISVHRNNIEMTKLLLKFGANPKSRDINGHLPEHFTESPELQLLLKEYSESLNAIEVCKRFQKKIAPRQLTLYLSTDSLISAGEQKRFENIFRVKFAKNLDKDVTHLIVEHSHNNVCEPSFQALKGILMGCAIVNVRWLKICLKKNKLVNFSDYEINGTKKFPGHNGPKIARNNFLEMNPRLFAGCNVFLRKMNFAQNIKELVTCSGAKLLNREPNPEHSPNNNFLFHCKPGHVMERTLTIILYETGSQEPELKYNMEHIKSLPVQWFYDCIQTFSIREP